MTDRDGEQEAGGERRRRRAPRPLGPESLDELALGYVARFLTSRAKLCRYLTRKLKERGWAGEVPPDVEDIADRLAAQNYLDDRVYAEAKAGGLLRRGYGGRRVGAALAEAGIGDEDRAGAMAEAERQAETAALRFAERKRIGPFAISELDRDAKAKALAAMVRAGHGFDLARRIVAAPPGEPFVGAE